MNIKEFQQIPISELAAVSGIDKFRWSKYLNSKQGISERTLKKVALKLELTPDELLYAVNERRKRSLQD